MTVFLDTVGLLALWDESDQWHKAAQASFSQLVGARADLITTSFIILECGNAASRRPYRGTVNQPRIQMEQGKRLIFPTAEDWKIGWLAYNTDNSSGPGIVDQISFEVMRRLGVSTAFTDDRHFRTAGSQTTF